MKKTIGAAFLASFLAGCLSQEPAKGRDLDFSGPFEKTVSLVRAMPPCDTIIGMSWGQTLPVPVEYEKETRVRVYFYPITGPGGQANRVYSPVAEALVDVKKGTAPICRNITDKPVKVGDIPALDPKRKPEDFFKLKEAERDLYRRTEAVIPAYDARKIREPGKDDRERAASFLRAFEAVVKPEMGLLPYYYQANPDFWEWVRKAAGRSIPAS